LHFSGVEKRAVICVGEEKTWIVTKNYIVVEVRKVLSAIILFYGANSSV
jgi:hypothetical protein